MYIYILYSFLIRQAVEILQPKTTIKFIYIYIYPSREMVVRLFVLHLAGKAIDYFATWPVGKQSESMLRHANAMPTHAFTMYKTGGFPLFRLSFQHVLAQRWHASASIQTISLLAEQRNSLLFFQPSVRRIVSRPFPYQGIYINCIVVFACNISTAYRIYIYINKYNKTCLYDFVCVCVFFAFATFPSKLMVSIAEPLYMVSI